MDRITRKGLKTDKFALEVEHTVEYLAGHRKQASRYGVVALVVIGLAVGITSYRRYQRTARLDLLKTALEIQNAPVGQGGNEFLRSFPSVDEKQKAVVKAFNEVINRHSGSDEATIARYYLGTNAADQGNLAEAEKWLRQVIDSSNANYASLAKLALAEVYRGQGKLAEAEKLLRSLIEKPTAFVSKEQATIVLAEILAPSQPDQARKLLEPLRTTRSAISRTSLNLLGQLPPK